MPLESSCKKISEPNYYHREYKNDIGEGSKGPSWGQQCQRVATVALPFFSLYKPLSLPISLGMGALRSWSSINQLVDTIQQGNSKDIPYQLLQASIAVVAFGGTIFAHPAGMLITTGHDLIIETVSLLEHLQNGEHQKALESCGSIINNALYLTLFSRGGLELAIASFAMQVILGIYHSHSEFQKGNYLEASGHLVMALIRSNQMAGQVQILQTKWKFDGLLKKTQKELVKLISLAESTQIRRLDDVGISDMPTKLEITEDIKKKVSDTVKKWLIEYCEQRNVGNLATLRSLANSNSTNLQLQWINNNTGPAYPSYSRVERLGNGNIQGIGSGWCRLVGRHSGPRNIWPNPGGVAVSFNFTFDGTKTDVKIKQRVVSS